MYRSLVQANTSIINYKWNKHICDDRARTMCDVQNKFTENKKKFNTKPYAYTNIVTKVPCNYINITARVACL